MKAHHENIDTLLKDALESNEVPPPALVHQIKSVAEEAGRKKQIRSGRLMKRLALAALCLIVVSATALAVTLFGLRDLALPDPEWFAFHPDATEEERSVQLISMQGFVGSPEHAAGVAWRTYLNEHGLEPTLAALSADWYSWSRDIPEQYLIYGAFSQEMIDKIHEIMERYSLSPRGVMLDIRTREELQTGIAYGPIFAGDSLLFTGRLYESGTFRLHGHAELISFILNSSRKGVFDNKFIMVEDIASFTEWHYENAHGVQLLLAQSAYQSLIILETETAFITVDIMAGTQGNVLYAGDAPFTRAELEQFADLIDFSQLRECPPDPEWIAMLDAKRIGAEDAMAALAGRWEYVSAEGAEGWLKIDGDGSFHLLHGEGVWAFHTSDSFDFTPGSWIISGDLYPVSRYTFRVHASMFSRATVYKEWPWWWAWDASLQYDPESGLLRLTDIEGIHRFYQRVS